MWSHCGSYVLADEIEILEPRAIIMLGTSDSWAAFWLKLGPTDQGRERRAVRNVWIEQGFRTTLRGRSVEVLVTPDPAAPGASSKALVNAVNGLLLSRSRAAREPT